MGEIGYKGFEKGLVCKGKQYAENTIFEEPEAVVCEKGMHYCKNPFDVLDYYDLVNSEGSFNEFATVEPLAEEKTNDNKKYCTTKLKIGAKFTFSGFIHACIDFVIENWQSGTVELTINYNCDVPDETNIHTKVIYLTTSNWQNEEISVGNAIVLALLATICVSLCTFLIIENTKKEYKEGNN